MKVWKNIVVVIAAVGATTLITERVASQDYKKKLDKKVDEHQLAQEKMQEQMQEEKEAWLKYGEPGPPHERMAKWVGTWRQETAHFMAPGAPPVVSTSTAKYKSMFGGRYFTQKMTGDAGFMGMDKPFEGFGIFGYDNITEKYFFVWIDNMSTMMMTAVGEEDETGAIVYHSEMPNPQMGGMMKVKSISRVVSEDQLAFEMHMQTPEGEWMKTMDLTGTRK